MTEARIQSLTADVEEFLKASGMSATTFGRKALSDPNFVEDLRLGRDPKESTSQRVRRFIAAATVTADQLAASG